ncbi:Uncharacterised protein [Vibrio cholerae]|nr:Uncharacterised protein [Vibrio cholerae]
MTNYNSIQTLLRLFLSIILLGRFLMLHSVTRISPICPRLSGRLFLSPITVWLAPLSKKRS